MAMNNKLKSRISWAIIFLMLWVLIGSLLCPRWWYKFFIELRLLDINYWLGGFGQIFEYFFYYNHLRFIVFSVVLPIFLTIIALKIYHKNLNLSLPDINIISKKNIAFSLVAIAIIVSSLFNSSINEDPNETHEPKDTKEVYKNVRFKPPIDFIYIDEKRISNLYSQIAPRLELENRTVEKSSETSGKISAGNPDIIGAEIASQGSSKKTDKFSAKKINPSIQVIEVLNYFDNTNSLKEYQTLKLSSDSLKKLDDFSNISDQYEITFDRNQYDTVYNRVLKETIFEQSNNFKNISNQILVTGDFVASVKKNLILSHDYINISNNKISFSLLPINSSSESIKSNILKSEEASNKVMKLNVFGKVVRVDSEEWGLNILFEPYAIW